MLGSTLSHYKITAELGRGGMGIVYRAMDTKLNREVALKILPAAALASDDDRARFFREAQAAAQLHHPNIATVFEIDEAILRDGEGNDVNATDGPRPYIAMEFVAGGTLEDAIKDAPLKLVSVIKIASQVAEALKAAHAKEIVHRDIKSANVMITEDGVAKVLDFGLAKTNQSTQLTRMGSTLGTIAYMSPEQARGQEVDGRTDLYSLGTMMYEMISGQLPFGGEYEQAVIYGILNEDPEPLTALRTGVSMELERIVFKLLAKNAGHRYQSAAGLMADLETIDVTSSTSSRPTKTMTPASLPESQKPTTSAKTYLGLGGAFALGAFLIWTIMSMSSRTDTLIDHSNNVLRFEAVVPSNGEIASVDISADGKTLVYASSSLEGDNVMVRDMASGQTRILAGTAGSQIVQISPDGESILLTKQLSVDRIPINRGVPLTVVVSDEGSPRANWGPAGWVIYEDFQGIWKASIDTDERFPLIVRDSSLSETDFDWPSLLPDGKTVMATVEYDGKDEGLIFVDFETGERVGLLQTGGFHAQFLNNGYILAIANAPVNEGTLIAIPFDVETFTQKGSVISLAGDVSPSLAAVSENGTLVYQPGISTNFFNSQPVGQLVRTVFPGSNEKLSFPPAVFTSFDLSPDGSKLAVTVLDEDATSNQGDESDVLVLNLITNARVELTSGLTGGSPTWYPGGDSIVYADYSNKQLGHVDVMIRAADGSGESRKLFDHNRGMYDLELSADGSKLTYISGSNIFGSTTVEVRTMSTGEVVELTDRNPANRRNPTFSADGGRVAYEEDGQIYIQSSDGLGLPLNFSTGAAWHPVWDPTGDALFFFGNGGSILRGEADQSSRSSVKMVLTLSTYREAFDIFPTGDEIINASPLLAAGMLEFSDTSLRADSSSTLTFVLNWFEELK